MMKQVNYILLIATLITVFFAACSKDFIEQGPADSIDPNDALKDETALGAAVNGIYAALRSVSLYGRDFPVVGDLQADNTYVETNNSGRYLSQYQYTVTVADGTASEMWAAAYTAIMRANRVIDADITGGNVPAIKAEAYALRGLLYFKLVNIFAQPYTSNPGVLGVPLVLHYDPYATPTRNTVQEVYAQIISDLQAGFTDAADYSSSVKLSRYAIEGLLAKAYLYSNDFQNAYDAAVDVIENSGFGLVTADAYRAYWNNSSPRTDGVETLFEVDADVTNNNQFDDIGAIYENGYQDIYASMQLYDLYRETDVRKSVMYEGETKNGAAAILVDKYPNANNSDRDNLKVIRLAEVYLIAAEAAARLGNDSDAKAYVNELASTRDPAFQNYTSTGAALINDIVEERRKELAFEGDRLYDLNRLMLPIERENSDGALPADLVIPYPDDRRIAPIPQDEIQANPNLTDEQNPGY